MHPYTKDHSSLKLLCSMYFSPQDPSYFVLLIGCIYARLGHVHSQKTHSQSLTSYDIRLSDFMINNCIEIHLLMLQFIHFLTCLLVSAQHTHCYFF